MCTRKPTVLFWKNILVLNYLTFFLQSSSLLWFFNKLWPPFSLHIKQTQFKKVARREKRNFTGNEKPLVRVSAMLWTSMWHRLQFPLWQTEGAVPRESEILGKMSGCPDSLFSGNSTYVLTSDTHPLEKFSPVNEIWNWINYGQLFWPFTNVMWLKHVISNAMLHLPWMSNKCGPGTPDPASQL